MRDFKTGKTFDAEGNVIASIALQLRLYALLIEALDPGCSVVLTVDTVGERRDVDWNDMARQETQEHLRRAIAGLPFKKEIMATDIAQVGNECLHCPVRHRCRRYQEAAPKWWREYPTDLGNAPADTWGFVQDVVVEGSEASLRLLDAAGRLVQVNHLRYRAGMDDLRGKHIFLFNLEKTGTARGWNGRPFQPHAFHELASDSSTRQAWTTEIFTVAN